MTLATATMSTSEVMLHAGMGVLGLVIVFGLCRAMGWWRHDVWQQSAAAPRAMLPLWAIPVLFMSMVAMPALLFAMPGYDMESIENDAWRQSVLAWCATGIAPLWILCWVWRKQGIWSEGLGEGAWKRALWGAPLGVAFFLLSVGMGAALLALWIWMGYEEPAAGHVALEGLNEISSSQLAGRAVAAIITAPIVEELFFRGVLQSGLISIIDLSSADRKQTARVRSRVVTVVVVAVIFMLVHIGGVAPPLLPVLFVFGLLLGSLVAVTRSLPAAILAHMVFNAVNFSMAWWQSAGGAN